MATQLKWRWTGSATAFATSASTTPERDEPCSLAATNANARLVRGRTVTLVRDVSNTDRYGRLLRYIYVGNTFVNEVLVRDGYAENSVWSPDTRYAGHFRALEAEARAAGRGLSSHRSLQ